MKIKSLVLVVTAALGVSTTMPLFNPTQEAQASVWKTKYSSGWYKVRIKKNTKVDRIKYGKAAYQNKISGNYTLHKGSIVTIGYYGRDGFDWLLKSPHKYKWTTKYAYSAHLKKGSFTVINHTK